MYNVLLVDDEDLIREAISKKLDWSGLGYVLAASCRNGKEAIDYIDNNKIDLLITDICMPYVDGIELSKYVFENHPEIKTIILSGYNEFDYAKNAMSYRVIEYILKPVTMSELSELLSKLYYTFEEEERKKDNLERLRKEYTKNLPLLRARFLNQLVHSQLKELEESEIKARLNDYSITFYGKFYKTVIVEPDIAHFTEDNPELEPDLPAFIIYNIIEEIVRTMETGISFQNLHNKTVIIFASDQKENLAELIQDVFTRAADILNAHYKIGITFGIGKEVRNLTHLKTSYDTAESVLEYRFLFGNNIVLDSNDFNKSKEESEIDITDLTSKLVLAIKINQETEIKDNLSAIIERLRVRRMSKNRVYIYLQNVVAAIGNLLEKAGLSEEPGMKEQDQIMHTLYEEKTLMDAEQILYVFSKKIGQLLSDQRNHFSTKQAVIALDYIDKNYGREDLSLQTICSELSISQSYFSSIFKNYTGETFTTVLTRKRMEKAKELLDNTNMKNYEIAEKVGFSDPHYFALTFKKVTGMTPKEYARERR